MMKLSIKYIVAVLFLIFINSCTFPDVKNISDLLTEPQPTINQNPTNVVVPKNEITPKVIPQNTLEIPTPDGLTLNSTISPTLFSTPELIEPSDMETGNNALFSGDYETAKQEFTLLYSSSTDESIKSAALWGLGKTEYLSGDISSSLETLRSVTTNFPESDSCSKAWFLLGEIYYSLSRFEEAAVAYKSYTVLRPGVLQEYVLQKLGGSFSSSNDLASAEDAYKRASQLPEQLDPINNQIYLANIYNINGNSEEALRIYDEIFTTTKNDYLKAQMDLNAGRALISLGRVDEGYSRWQDAVNNYPMSYESYSALLGLVSADQVVDEFNRGLVDYYANQYDVALQAFDRYLAANPENDGTVFYYFGQIYRDMGEYDKAVENLNRFIQNFPKNRYWEAAWDDRSTIQWLYMDDYQIAADGLEEFAAKVPASSLAPTYLFEAARIYERDGQLERSAQLWESLPARYDADPGMSNSWFQAGIVRYRMGNISSANKDFQESLLISKTADDRARSLLWIGKTYAITGDMGNANSAWEQAQQAAPSTYYSFRARDLLENRPPFTSPPSINLKVDLGSERDAAASWVKVKFGLPIETDLSSIDSLSTNQYFQQGNEFWNLGMYDQAKIQFEKFRSTLVNNPADSFRFGNYLLKIGMIRSGIYVLRDLLTLAGLDEHSTSLTAPIYFTHIRYGLYYSDIIWQTSTDYNFDPLFITSVIRQESLFEGFVHSSAGARGLMQIMPATGENIAKQMGWPNNYSADDLYSPMISIKMGTYYLNSNRKYLNGDFFSALAGYNSGLGNASIWQDIANGDPDLELEVIRYSETRDYIRGIYENFTTYRSLYSPME